MNKIIRISTAPGQYEELTFRIEHYGLIREGHTKFYYTAEVLGSDLFALGKTPAEAEEKLLSKIKIKL